MPHVLILLLILFPFLLLVDWHSSLIILFPTIVHIHDSLDEKISTSEKYHFGNTHVFTEYGRHLILLKKMYFSFSLQLATSCCLLCEMWCEI